jgi:hypothetical protein
MTEQSNNQQTNSKTRNEIEAHIIAQAWKDDAYKQELISNPKVVFEKEFCIQLPAEVNVQVMQETSTNLYIVIPQLPRQVAEAELNEDELEAVAGGIGPLAIAGIVAGGAALVGAVHGALEEHNRPDKGVCR